MNLIAELNFLLNAFDRVSYLFYLTQGQVGNNVNYLTICAHVSNSWDEWVGIDRLMKYTDENIQKQQALEKKQGVDKNQKSARSALTKPKGSTGQPPSASKY